MLAVEIREIRPDEADALADLTVRVYEAIGATEGGEYIPHLRDVAGRMETCTVLVAVEDGVVIGGVAYVPGPGEWSDRAQEGEAEFRMLVVDPEHQGRGTGEALTRACIDLARRAGRDLVILSQRSMTAAHRIYDRLGFVRAPDRDWYISPEVDLLCFTLTIPHPARG
jgi:predicted N-acetyltransferase YhbS